MPLAAFPKCYLNALCADHTMTVYDWIERAAAELDIDGLEFYWGFTPYDRPDEIQRIRERVTAHRLCIPMMCYSPDFIKPDPQERRAEIEKSRVAIATTAALGGSYCRVLSGQRLETVSIREGVKLAADSIQELIPYAREHNVTLILENHYKDGFWKFPEFAQKMDVFLALLDAIPPSPNFGVNYDPSNTIIAGEDPIALLEAVKTRVVTMHASDRYFEGGTAADLRKLEAHPQTGYAKILRHGIIGHGLNDYDRIFSILKSAGFNGWISIEDGEDVAVGMEHLRESAVFLRKKMKEHGLS
jgi:sugar phosphate isomerase/epimerase